MEDKKTKLKKNVRDLTIVLKNMNKEHGGPLTDRECASLAKFTTAFFLLSPDVKKNTATYMKPMIDIMAQDVKKNMDAIDQKNYEDKEKEDIYN